MFAGIQKKKFEKNWKSAILRAVIATPFKAGVVAVDCDSVILHHEPEESIRLLGPVLPAGALLVSELKKRKFRVVVLTARPERQHQDLLIHLCRNRVWVDRVTNRKPYADAYFDDKAVRISKNWK